jgi:hypothetical protein
MKKYYEHSKYSYNPRTHLKFLLKANQIVSTSSLKNVPDEVITIVHNCLSQRKLCPYVKTIKNILNDNNYSKHDYDLTEIITKLGYMVPHINNEEIDLILNYFSDNNDEFITCKKPLKYCSFYKIIDCIIKKLNLGCSIALVAKS